LYIFFIAIGLTLSYVFGVILEMGAKGIGLGLSVSSLLMIIILMLYIKFSHPFKVFKPNKETKYTIKMFKDISQEAVAGISVSFYKGVALLILSLALPTRMDDYVPLSYQMARVI
jgi:Na+-driven multidrug efflux pump